MIPRNDKLQYLAAGAGAERRQRQGRAAGLRVRAAEDGLQEALGTAGRAGETLVKKNTVLVVGGTGTLGRQVGHCTSCQASIELISKLTTVQGLIPVALRLGSALVLLKGTVRESVAIVCCATFPPLWLGYNLA